MQSRTILRAAAVAACLGGAAASATPASAASPTQVGAALTAGANWLRAQQSPTTGGLSIDFAIPALVAARVNAADVQNGSSPTLQDFAQSTYSGVKFSAPLDPSTNDNGQGGKAGEFAKGTLVAAAAGLDPYRIADDVNLPAQLAAAYKRDTGAVGKADTASAAFALLALARVNAPAPVLAKTAGYLQQQQHDDGGWSFGTALTPASRASGSDADTTGAVLGALCESGVSTADGDVRRALSFLQGRLRPSGAIRGPSYGPENADTNGWVLSGLNACGVDAQSARWTSAAGKTPVDFLIGLQRTTGPDTGSIKYLPSEADSDGPNLYAHQDALRALGGEVFSATPPQRANPADPRLRPVTAPAAGTVTPHAIAVDDGRGDVRFYRVSFAVGATLPDVLAAAQAGTAPAGCVESYTVERGMVTAINGRLAGANGGWRVRLGGRPEAPAGTQAVGFGDTVALRLVAPAADAGTPGAAGADGATGSSGAKGADGANGADGKPGAAGPAGAQGASGVDGRPGTRGPRGRTAIIRCTQSRRTRRVTCRVSAPRTATARLTRRGRTYASGRLGDLVAKRRLVKGTYTLRLGSERHRTNHPVVI